MLRRAFETQLEGAGFSFVEILTMCPTGWFVRRRRARATCPGAGSVHASASSSATASYSASLGSSGTPVAFASIEQHRVVADHERDLDELRVS